MIKSSKEPLKYLTIYSEEIKHADFLTERRQYEYPRFDNRRQRNRWKKTFAHRGSPVIQI